MGGTHDFAEDNRRKETKIEVRDWMDDWRGEIGESQNPYKEKRWMESTGDRRSC